MEKLLVTHWILACLIGGQSRMVVSIVIGVPYCSWMVYFMENPIVRYGWELGVPPFLEAPKCFLSGPAPRWSAKARLRRSAVSCGSSKSWWPSLPLGGEPTNWSLEVPILSNMLIIMVIHGEITCLHGDYSGDSWDYNYQHARRWCPSSLAKLVNRSPISLLFKGDISN